MANPLRTQLRVPADGRFLAMVQNHVRDLATTTGLPAKDILALELAAEEAFLNIRDHAYPDVELYLPLAQPDTPSLGERAEAAGFFFAGVWPHAAGDGDVSRLTRLASPLDMGQLRFDGDFALPWPATWTGSACERRGNTAKHVSWTERNSTPRDRGGVERGHGSEENPARPVRPLVTAFDGARGG